jgi:hypothetical protein
MTGETPTPPDLTDGKVNRIAAVSKRPLPAMFLRATKSPSSRVRALSRSSWTTPSVTSVKSVVSPGSPQSIDPLVLLRGLDSWFLGIPRLRRGRFCQTNPFSINKDGPFAKKRTHFDASFQHLCGGCCRAARVCQRLVTLILHSGSRKHLDESIFVSLMRRV